MSKKKKIIIASVVVLVLVTVGIMFALYYGDDKNRDKESPKDPASSDTEHLKDVKLADMELEIGSEVPDIKSFIQEEYAEGSIEITKDDNVITDEVFNDLGDYQVKIVLDGKNYTSHIKIVDKTAPVLELKEVKLKESDKYAVKDFIESCTDNSKKECILEFAKEEMGTFKSAGSYDISIIAKDESDNTVEKTTKLVLEKKSTGTSTPNKDQTKPDNTNNTKPDTNSNTTTTKKFVKSDTESKATTTEKYGVQITTTKYTTYNYYSDGSKTEVSSYSRNKYDQSRYHATTAELLAEASKNASTYASQVKEVFKYVNELRAKEGKEPLVLDATLTKAAMVRSLEMAYSGKFSHTRPNGSSCFTIDDEMNYSGFIAGENIAAGQRTPQSVFNSWNHSQGHHDNMVGSNFKKIGIGLAIVPGTQYDYYWTQLFATN